MESAQLKLHLQQTYALIVSLQRIVMYDVDAVQL